MKRLFLLLPAIVLVIGGCSDDDDSSDAGDGSVDTDKDTDTDTDTESDPWTSACGITGANDVGADFFVDISDSSGIRVDNFDPSPPVTIPINDHSRLGFAALSMVREL